jgi:hypothetical protein
MKKVTVYSFKGYKVTTNKTIISDRMATLDAIKRFGCTPIMERSKEVDASEVDEEGRYPKIKTHTVEKQD